MRPEPTEKKISSPAAAGDRSVSALPPPGGKPVPEQALQLLRFPGSFGAAGRAGMAAAVQRTVGNARVMRLAQTPTAAPGSECPGKLRRQPENGTQGVTPLDEEEAVQRCAGCPLGGGCGGEAVRRNLAASTPSAPPPAIQRRLEDYHRVDDGAVPERRLKQAVDREVPETDRRKAGGEAAARDRMRKVDRSELAAQGRQLEPAAQPDVDRPTRERTGVEGAARQTESAAKSPGEPVAKGAESAAATVAGAKGGGEGGGAAGEAAAEPAAPAAGLAESAFALAASIPEPAAPSEVVAPEPVVPVDAGGQPLPGDPAGDAEVAGLAGQIQVLREQGLMIRQRAAQERGNAEMLRGSLEQVRSGVATAERGVASSRGHLEYRRQALSTARRALTVSEEKTARVAREAPEFRSKADQGRADSGPMARQARQRAGENARRSPEDGEAAGNARRQGRQLSRVADDAATIDRAITGTRQRAGSLAEEAARAQGLNEQTRGKLDQADATLAGTTGRIGELDRQTRDARTQVEALVAQPDQLVAQAEALDQQGLRLIEASQELEQRLHQVERSYAQGMRGVPAARPAEESPEEEPVQRTPDDDSYEGRERIDPVSALPSWLTGAHDPTEQQRREAAAAEQQRRKDEIAEIRTRAGGNFASLNAGKKMGIALSLTGRNLFRSVGNIRWPGFGALALGIIDPRGPLRGVLGGLGMMLSGGANLLSAEQWRRDPVGNALKSAADIATGLTVILGSITALAGVIAAAMTALTILSLGFAAPVTGPIIAFCTSVMIAVGGWTIAVGKIALVLQALVLIKNLIDAATARTAEDLQSQSDQIRADVGNAGNVLLQMGMAKLAQKGGQAAQRGIEGAGGGVRAAA
ncbi:MAG: hypothetical protein GY856_11030, partial [bacterium]|nr:hypothetical protein [bacterium]